MSTKRCSITIYSIAFITKDDLIVIVIEPTGELIFKRQLWEAFRSYLSKVRHHLILKQRSTV